VHRIFGKNSTSTLPKNDICYNNLRQRSVNKLGVHHLNSHLLNIHYQTDNNLNISVYDYLIENIDQKSFSTQTVGLRIQDELKPNKIKYRYSVELAQQNAFNNPNSFNT
jgi:hypothetical protein